MKCLRYYAVKRMREMKYIDKHQARIIKRGGDIYGEEAAREMAA